MKRIPRLRAISLRDLLLVVLPGALLIGLAFWAALQFVKPAPPDYVVMSTGPAGGAYQAFAAQFSAVLARNNIRLEQIPSAGAVENLARLRDREQALDIAFIQGGTERAATEGEDLAALGSIYYEPLWVFYRGRPGLDRVDALKGKRIAIGAEGSGTRRLSLMLLEAHGMDQAPTRLLPLGGMAAAAALEKGEVDAVFAVGPAHSSAVWAMLYAPRTHLLNFSQAEAYTRRLPFLSPLTLPRGTIDLLRDVPDRNISLVATTASLVARDTLHPALESLILQAMTEIHGAPGVFEKTHEFPAARLTDFPVSDQAQRYFKSGPPLLQRYLPFWAAVLIERLWVMALPLIGVLIPVIRFGPALYGMRVRSRIFRYYGQLKLLEHRMVADWAARTPQAWMDELAEVERGANQIPAPKMFASDIYTLRLHIDLVRGAMQRRMAGPPAPVPA